jgi:hypothetical protein
LIGCHELGGTFDSDGEFRCLFKPFLAGIVLYRDRAGKRPFLPQEYICDTMA